jgi:hypothetical protein
MGETVVSPRSCFGYGLEQHAIAVKEVDEIH